MNQTRKQTLDKCYGNSMTEMVKEDRTTLKWMDLTWKDTLCYKNVKQKKRTCYNEV